MDSCTYPRRGTGRCRRGAAACGARLSFILSVAAAGDAGSLVVSGVLVRGGPESHAAGYQLPAPGVRAPAVRSPLYGRAVDLSRKCVHNSGKRGHIVYYPR